MEGNSVMQFFRALARTMMRYISTIFRRQFTIMLVPHNDSKVMHFHIGLLGIIFLCLLVIAMLTGFFFATARFIGSEEIIQTNSERLKSVEANLELVLDELTEFIQVSELFSSTLDDALDEADIKNDAPQDGSTLFASGDLLSFSNIYQSSANEPQQLQSLKAITEQLRSSIRPLEEMRSMLVTQRELLTSLPNKWPIAGSLGRVTMEFGPNIHPFTGQWYLHKGFDISGPLGVAVVASADGKVVDLGYDPGYGLNVWVRHHYGFRTHYSHLQSISVSEGQEVEQGQRIGTLGNTGISTGPHLDFQIWIGTEVVDPAAFLKISNTFARWTGNR